MSDLAFRGTFEDKISPTLKKIEGNVEKLNENFSSLKKAIGGLAIGAAIRNVINLADGIQDVSDATGIAIQNVLGFQQAVSLNGGTAEQATQSIYRLTQSIGEAAAGGKKAQDAFNEVGVTLQDLSTLSEQDILSKTIQGLANIDDAGKRAVLTTDLLGKGFRGINVQGVAGQLTAATSASIQYTKAVQQTAEMQNKLDLAFQKLQLSLLKTIQPLVELINKMDDEKVGNLIEAIVKLSAAIAALAASVYVIEKLAKAFVVLGVAFAATFASFKFGAALMTLGFASIGATAVKTVQVFSAWWRLTPRFAKLGGRIGSLGKLFGELLARLRYFVTAIVAIGIGLARMLPYIGLVVTAFLALNETLKTFTSQGLFGWIDVGINKMKEFLGFKKEMEGTSAPDQSDAETKRLQRQNDTLKAQADKIRDVESAVSKKRKEIENITKAFKDQSSETLQSIALEEKYIGVSADTAEILKAQDEIYKRQQTEIEKLRDAKKALGNDEKSLGSVYDAQIIKISVQAQKDAERVAVAVSGLQKVRNAEAARLNLIEATNQQLEKQASIESQMRDAVTSIQRSLEDTQIDNIANSYERGMAKIKTDTERTVADIRKQFEGMIDESTMNPAEVQRLNEALIAMEEKFYAVGRAREAAFMKDNPQTFAEGWKAAFDSYIENSTNAAKMAGDAFSSLTSNMNSAIDKFVDSGKFSFSDFATSVIKDLIKIELKAQASKLLSGVLSSAGNFLGSLLGFANGGQPPVNKPSIVGEKGPELFVPKTAGTIIPNNQMGSGGAGAAGGNTYITNNISAVDAKSVAQLFAENRRVLFGTVEMARKEMSYGR